MTQQLLHALSVSAATFWNILGDMAPFLLLGFAAAGLLHILMPASKVEAHLGGRGLLPVIKAALIGVPLPLCSCGVIPVALSLRRHGASRGATLAFLLSTPQTGVDSFLATFSLLGPVFAIFRPLAAFFTGLLGGAAVNSLAPEPEHRNNHTACDEDCCSHTTPRSTARRMMRHAFVVLPRDLAWPLLWGLLAAAAIALLVPDDLFAGRIGSGPLGIALMMLLGIPIYVCATASIPIALALIAKGASPGAALAFLISGPATNTATLAMVWKSLGTRTALIYLATVAISAFTSGMIMDTFLFTVHTTPVSMCHDLLPPILRIGATFLFIGILLHAVLADKLAALRHPAANCNSGGS